ELTYYLEPNVPLNVIGDPSRLRQVLLNLAGNALKFTSQGEVGIRVSVERVSESRVQLHVAVNDTGVGIPTDKQRRLFQPFEQADSSTTRRYGGTGLGLAISARIVQLMGVLFGWRARLTRDLLSTLRLNLANRRHWKLLLTRHPRT